MIKGYLFDLDGVIVDTAKYHYLAWKRLADSIGIAFTEHDNELLKGVSRVESLKIILRLGNHSLSEADFAAALTQKNQWYLDYINQIGSEEILPGINEFIADIKAKGCKIALGSASKNAGLILERIGLMEAFDAIIDGNKVENAKPDPEVFLKAAEQIDVAPKSCVVFEDAAAGVLAAKNANMYCVGVGLAENLPGADVYLEHFKTITVDQLLAKLGK